MSESDKETVNQQVLSSSGKRDRSESDKVENITEKRHKMKDYDELRESVGKLQEQVSSLIWLLKNKNSPDIDIDPTPKKIGGSSDNQDKRRKKP